MFKFNLNLLPQRRRSLRCLHSLSYAFFINNTKAFVKLTSSFELLKAFHSFCNRFMYHFHSTFFFSSSISPSINQALLVSTKEKYVILFDTWYEDNSRTIDHNHFRFLSLIFAHWWRKKFYARFAFIFHIIKSLNQFSFLLMFYKFVYPSKKIYNVKGRKI